MRSYDSCCRKKTNNIKNLECVFVTLIIQHAKRLCCNVSSSVAYRAIPYFSNKLPRFSEKFTESKMCFEFHYEFFSEAVIIIRKIYRDITINIHNLSPKVPVILSHFSEK